METETVKSRTWAGVKGSTVVNHKLRLIYNLSYPEYIIMDYIQWYAGKYPGKRQDPDLLWKMTGHVLDSDFIEILHLLSKKGLVKLIMGTDSSIPSLAIPEPTEQWLKNFDLTADFEGFWSAYGKVGNKEKAKGMYVKARKVVDKDTLDEAVKKYVTNLGDTFQLHASTYLNPKNKHWEDVVVEKKKVVNPADQKAQYNEETF